MTSGLFQPPKKSAQEINTTNYAFIYRFKARFGLIFDDNVKNDDFKR